MTQKTILFLDDEEWRRTAFEQIHKGTAQVYYAKTIAGFLSILYKYPGCFDEIHLDHDLGDDLLEGDGMQAAQTLVLLPASDRPKKVYVHSWNMVRSEQMEVLLRNAGFDVTRRPFSPSAYNV